MKVRPSWLVCVSTLLFVAATAALWSIPIGASAEELPIYFEFETKIGTFTVEGVCDSDAKSLNGTVTWSRSGAPILRIRRRFNLCAETADTYYFHDHKTDRTGIGNLALGGWENYVKISKRNGGYQGGKLRPATPEPKPLPEVGVRLKWHGWIEQNWNENDENALRGDDDVEPGTYTIENAGNRGWYLTHTGPAKNGGASRNVTLMGGDEPDWPKTEWILHKTGDGQYLIENAGNRGWYLTHTGPAERGEASRNVTLMGGDEPDWPKTEWILHKNGDGQYLIENAGNRGWYLTHTGPAKNGEAARNVTLMGGDEPDWPKTPWILHR